MFKEKIKLSVGDTDTLIGHGTEMDGHLKSEAGIRIDGTFTGDIDCKGDLVIGEKGEANSTITARDVTIAGKVRGDVHTRGKLVITSSGQLHGDSYAATLIVQEGGVLNGSSKMERAEFGKAAAVGHDGGSGGGKTKQAG